MKKIFNLICLFATVAATATLTGCKDEPDKYEVADGRPVVNYIRPLDPAKADSLLDGAYMDNQICIVGENLRSVTKLLFNDQEAKLVTSLITDNTLIVTVPGNIPSEVTNKMYMINNAKDTTVYDFKVLVPGPVINSMSNEWGQIGELVSIYGNYFVNTNSQPVKVTINGKQIPNDNLEVGLQQINFVVTEDMTEGPIVVTSIYGSAKSIFNFHDTRGMLFNDWGTGDCGGKSTMLTNHGWHNMPIQTDEYSIDGAYLLLGDCDLEDGSWADGNVSFEYWPGDWDGNFTGADSQLSDLVSFANWENMALKFECNIPSSNPWNNLSMQCIFSGNDQVTLKTANNTFFNGTDYARGLWTPWQQNGEYHTEGLWKTITLPLADFKYKNDGTLASNPLTQKNFTGLTLFIWSGVTSGKTCHPIIRIDNVRAVAIK
mgnify:FL=1